MSTIGQEHCVFLKIKTRMLTSGILAREGALVEVITSACVQRGWKARAAEEPDSAAVFPPAEQFAFDDPQALQDLP